MLRLLVDASPSCCCQLLLATAIIATCCKAGQKFVYHCCPAKFLEVNIQNTLNKFKLILLILFVNILYSHEAVGRVFKKLRCVLLRDCKAQRICDCFNDFTVVHKKG